MNAPTGTPRFVVVDTEHGDPGLSGFVRGIAMRVTWMKFLGALIVFFLLGELHELANFAGVPKKDLDAIYPAEMWLSSVVILVSQGLSFLFAILAADEAVARGSRRLRTYALAVVLGACLGAWLQWEIRALFHLRVMTSLEEDLIRITQPAKVALDMMMYGGLATFVYVNVRTARLAAARRREAEIARGQSRRRTLESQLQAMQARVEPQFLFNTLAQVKQLYDTDAERAGTMLDDLIAYLRAALPHLRESSSTLGKEVELARAYLAIVRVRLGNRLSFDIDVPESLKNARIPPMMLLPLVDHALVYGLEPAHDGGTIRIVTEVAHHRLRLSIADNGAGFVAGNEASGLDDIAARLEALYGDDANFRLDRMQADGIVSGTRATLEIPYEADDRSHR